MNGLNIIKSVKSNVVSFFQQKKRAVVAILASLSAVVLAPSAMAAPAFTPGSSSITSDMLDPIVESIIATIGTVATAAFLLLGFSMSIYIGIRVVKSMVKTTAA